MKNTMKLACVALGSFFSLSIASASQPAAHEMHFHKISIADQQMQGAEAYTLLVPTDWKTSGGVVWDTRQIYYPASVNMRVTNPAGDEQLALYPAMHFAYFNTPMGRQLEPQGSRYLGSLVEPVEQDCRAALEHIAWPATHDRINGARVVDFTDLPDFAKAYQDQLPQLPNVQYTVKAGKLRIEYPDPQTGALIREDLVGVLSIVDYPQLGSGSWHIDRLVGYRSAAADLDKNEKQMEAIATSFRLNVNWYAGYCQVVQTLMAIVRNASAAAAARAQIRFEAQQQVSDDIQRQFEHTQEAADKCNASFDQVIRGVQEYQNTDGSDVELPNTYSHAWSNGAGDYILSNNSLYNPNATQQGAWQQLQARN